MDNNHSLYRAQAMRIGANVTAQPQASYRGYQEPPKVPGGIRGGRNVQTWQETLLSSGYHLVRRVV